jgi:hypothetical protein
MTSIQIFWVELSVSPGPLTSTAKMRKKEKRQSNGEESGQALDARSRQRK